MNLSIHDQRIQAFENALSVSFPRRRKSKSSYNCGTAIALHLGHRRSIDFDLFTSGRLKKQSIKRTIGRHTDASRLFLYKVTLNLMQGAVPN